MQSQSSQKSQRPQTAVKKNRDAVKKCRNKQKRRLQLLTEENIILRGRLNKYKLKYRKMKQKISQTTTHKLKPKLGQIDLTKNDETKVITTKVIKVKQEHDLATLLASGQQIQLATTQSSGQEPKAEHQSTSSAQILNSILSGRHSPWSIQAPVHTPTSECKS